MEKEITSEVARKGLCPLIQNPPSDDCYCVKLESLSIEAAINYCGKNFSECEIYKSLYEKDGKAANVNSGEHLSL